VDHRVPSFARAPKNYVPVEYACFEGNDKNLVLMIHDITGISVQCRMRGVSEGCRENRPADEAENIEANDCPK